VSTRLPALGPRGEGWLALQIVLMLGIVLGAGIPVTPQPEQPTRDALLLLGGVVLIAGLAVALWGSMALRTSRAFSAAPRPTEVGALVETGPYRWVRHPIYFGVIIAGLGVAASQMSVVSLIATVALAGFLDLKRRREEAWLLERYPAYGAYRQRTKALIPFVY
jgi:protein-S-isoprenylcysteine O-methyltransferase Ste14